MKSRVLALSLLSLVTATAALADEPDVSIEAPVSSFDSVSLHDYGAPVMRGEDDEPQRDWSEREELAGVLEDLLLDEVEAAGGSLYASENELVVAGGPNVVDLVRRRVAAIDAFVQGKATLRVAAVHVDAASDAVSAESIRTALAQRRARVIWSSRISARRGEPIVRDVTESQTFIGDFDVEVAVSASIADPNVWSLQTGWRISVQQRPLDAERALVGLAFHLSKVVAMESVEVGAGSLQRPRVPFVSVTVPLILRKGAPDVVFVDHPFEPGVLAVVVELLDLPSVPSLPYRLVDTAAHAGFAATAVPATLGLEDFSVDGPEEMDPHGRASALLDRIVVADAGIPLTSTLIAVTNDEFSLPEQTARRLSRSTWRDVTPAELPRYDPLDGSLVQATVDALRVSAPPSSRFALFTQPGARTSCFSGVWTRVIADFDVEIADTAAITDPIVYSFVEGDLVQVTASGVGASGDIAVHWGAVRAFKADSLPIVVRKDISGKRSEEQNDRIDFIRHRAWSGLIVVTDDAPADVRLTGDTAEIDIWSRD